MALTKRQAWNYAFGMLKIDGLSPSDTLLALSEKEISGEITLDEIHEQLDLIYKNKNISSGGNQL